jgi:hypothetical protein
MDRKCERMRADASGVLFKSCSDTAYLSLDAHRSAGPTKHPKSLWAISRPEECHVFCDAEVRHWLDAGGDYWAVTRDDSLPFGTRGERMAFFSSPTNNSDPWHGFPVGGRRGMKFRSPPPDELVERWHKEGLISYTTYTRILTRRL